MVIDPGPQLDSHRDALHRALVGCTVRAILVTHCHADHSPLAAWLTAETGAPTIGFGPHLDDRWDIGDDPIELEPDRPPTEPPTPNPAATGGGGRRSRSRSTGTFVPAVVARTGDIVAAGGRLDDDGACTRPGTRRTTLCYSLDDGATRTLFTGDHVMGWSTTVVSPPDGDMAAYFESLRLVAGRRDDVLIPTHGPPIDRAGDVRGRPRRPIALERERQVLDAVRDGCSIDRLDRAAPVHRRRPTAAQTGGAERAGPPRQARRRRTGRRGERWSDRDSTARSSPT